MITRRLSVLLAVGFFFSANPASAYIDAAPTLGKLIKDADYIMVLRVEAVSQEKRVIIYKKVADLKGKCPGSDFKHQITDGYPPREPTIIMDWAEPGAMAICFASGNTCMMCLGDCWYEAYPREAPWWSMTRSRPELSLAYHGSISKLRPKLADIIAGKEAVITTMVHGANSFGVYFDVAFKDALGGKGCPVQRVKASLRMPNDFWHIGKDPKFFVGFGPAGAADVPALVKALQDQDRQVRIEAATDLGLMGPSAKEAVPALLEALKDQEALVRLRADEALMKIEPKTKGAMAALLAGLKAPEATVRRVAAQLLANLGADAKPAIPLLLECLKDADAKVRGAAALALGEIGPEAEVAVPALIEGLKDKSFRCAAATALGGIGAKARPAIPALAKALEDEESRFRWAAVGALARIGGPGSKAAVPVLVKALSGSERDHYNATLYLSALGPEAKDSIPALKKGYSHSEDLRVLALWSIDPQNGVQGYLLHGLATDRACDQWFIASHFQMMGARRKDAALSVAEALLDGRLNTLAPWAVDLILRGQAEVTVPLLAAGLNKKDAAVRARAAAALGMVGPQAKSAEPALTAALKDKDGAVRTKAGDALKKIQGK